MKANIGNIDRALRILVGLILITLAAMDIFAPWGWIGVVPLLTGLIKFCPTYSIFGFSSFPQEKK
jgi:hypothetical protein